MLSKELSYALQFAITTGHSIELPSDDARSILSHIKEQEEVIARLTEWQKVVWSTSNSIDWLARTLRGKRLYTNVDDVKMADIIHGLAAVASAMMDAISSLDDARDALSSPPQSQEEDETPTSSKGEST